MIWGSQWDAVIRSFGDVSGERGTFKGAGLSGNVHKNIYDMAGNLRDWTLEAEGTNSRVCRGGNYDYPDPASTRNIYYSTSTGDYFGTRATLLINL